MIVVADPPRLLLITQTDHANLAGELLSLWRADGLPDHPRRAELIFATRQHDNGWRELDAAPAVDPGSGGPRGFADLPAAERIALWQRATERFAAARPYAAALITQHALELHRTARGAEPWDDFLDEMTRRRDELAETAGVAAGEVARDYRFLDLADLVSLSLCSRRGTPFARHGLRGRVRAGTAELDPFPLAGATTFTVPCRRIPARRYRGDGDLGGELAAARWVEIDLRVAAWTASPQSGGRPPVA